MAATVDGPADVEYGPPPSAVQSNHFDGATVFSATMARNREPLGERVTAWLAGHPENQIVDAVVTQSSDAQFHCITVTLFWREAR